MGIRKFRSVEEMPGPPRRRPLDPENLRIAFGLAELAQGFHPVRLKPGVYKYASWDELLAALAKRTGAHLCVGRPDGS
jgi:hypothetical protein